MKVFLIPTVVLTLATATPGQSQTAPDAPPEKAAILANARSFETTHANGDVKAIAGCFAENAEYTTEEGRTFAGNAAVAESMELPFQENKGAKLTIHVDSVQVLTPEVVVEQNNRQQRRFPESIASLCHPSQQWPRRSRELPGHSLRPTELRFRLLERICIHHPFRPIP